MPLNDATPKIELDQATGAEDVDQLTTEHDFMDSDDFNMSAAIEELNESINQYIQSESNTQQYSNGSNLPMCIESMEDSKQNLVTKEEPIQF
ncbi:unnamed protein product, partial [Iphiclides podalirius]